MLKNLFALTMTLALAASCSSPMATNSPIQPKGLQTTGRTGVFAVKDALTGGLTTGGGLSSGGGTTQPLTLEEQLTAAKAALAGLKASRADLQDTKKPVRLQIKAEREVKRDKAIAIRELKKNDLKNLKQALNAKLAEEKQIQQAIKKRDKGFRVTSLETDLQAVQDQITDLNTQITAKTAEIALLQAEIDGLNSEVDALRAQIADINAQIQDINDQIQAKQTEITAIQNKIIVRDKNIIWIVANPCPAPSDKAKYEYDATGLIISQTCTPCALRFGKIALLGELQSASLTSPGTVFNTIYRYDSISGIGSDQGAFNFFYTHQTADAQEDVSTNAAGGTYAEFEADCHKCEEEGYTYTHFDNSPQCTTDAAGNTSCTLLNTSVQHTRFCHQPYDGDSDGDGVLDSADLCGVTPWAEAVDSTGCPTIDPDTDGDGIANLIDHCAYTPAGVTVDTTPGLTTGCSGDTTDSDADGVFDESDGCPGVGIFGQVDDNGCPSAPLDPIR